MAGLKELQNDEIILLKSYTAYAEAGQRNLGAKYRKRVEVNALDAGLHTMQDALSTLLSVAVTGFEDGVLTLLLPARGRIGLSRIVETPNYRVLTLPNSNKKVAAIRRGADNFVAIPDFSLYLVEHHITLDSEMFGAAPLFGDLPLHLVDDKWVPVRFSFAL